MPEFLCKTKQALRALWRGADRALLCVCACAAACGMLAAHGFAFFNLFPNHDSTVLYFDAQWTMYVLGRWAQNLYFPLVRGKIAAPWLVGLFCMAFAAATGYLLARLLRLGRGAAALLTALLCTAPCVTMLFATYGYEADAYFLAMLLACLGVWCAETCPALRGVPLAACCFCLTLGLYQAYISFAVGLFLALLAQRALAEELPWRAWLWRGGRALLALGLGGGLYFVSVKASLAFSGYGAAADTGNGLRQLTRLTPGALLSGAADAYVHYFQTLLGDSNWNTRQMRVASALLLLLAAAGLARRLWTEKSARRAVQALVPLALLPLALDAVYPLVSGNVYLLMCHAFWLVYALPLLWGNRALCGGALCAFLILQNVIYANGAYTYTKLMYENTAQHMYGIMQQVEALDGYEPGKTEIAFVGDFNDSALAYRNRNFARYEDDSEFMQSAVTYDGTIRWWFTNVMGSSANVLVQDLDVWAEDARVQALPAYPEQGYCAMLDGVAVVKISD